MRTSLLYDKVFPDIFKLAFHKTVLLELDPLRKKINKIKIQLNLEERLAQTSDRPFMNARVIICYQLCIMADSLTSLTKTKHHHHICVFMA